MQFCFSQSVQTITDKKDILIGEQIRLTVKAASPLNVLIPDSIPHFEIVETGDAKKTGKNNDANAGERTMVITSFDSGRWVFPPLQVELTATGQTPKMVQTDSFFVDVSFSPPDTTNELRDIKPIMPVSVGDYFWYYLIGGAVLLLILGILLYNYFKKNRKEKPAKPVSKLSAYNEALAALEKLTQLDLRNPVTIKEYHSRLYLVKQPGTCW
jgi:hypothetical protein